MDTGSLAGDFINYEVLNILSATDHLYNTTFNIYSGLDNSNVDSLTALYITLNLENYCDEFHNSENYSDDMIL